MKIKKYEIFIKKLEIYKNEFLKISKSIIQPNILSDKKKYKFLIEKYNELEKIFLLYNEFKKKIDFLKEADFIIKNDSDKEIIKFAITEKINLVKKLECIKNKLCEKIKYKKIKKDNYRNVILEIRSGTGGDEACLFVEDILRMYIMYFKKVNWGYKIINYQQGTKGYKEVIIDVYSKNKKHEIYGNLKFESGVHRVQRIPKTESQGRLHTSAITIAVLPKVENIEISINPVDIKKYTFRSSGAGGQHVNKTESAVRLVHLPSNIKVECQEERSQHKNFEKAMMVLKSKIYNNEIEKRLKDISTKRKSLILTGDRSVKIRTYNYHNNRVTDHRIHKSIHNLNEFMNGNIQEMINALRIEENKLKFL
ncbi:peptide chain release factor 1 [Blattabacterium cuenoti]|uniref:peptide chain release factor 1 n=1 Tax=Blattabacterium cuenoti TaxID=1653831 RepID=UPI00163C91AE|nr:PCRF domain-containing protein [Blattabacterium cuenoti]